MDVSPGTIWREKCDMETVPGKLWYRYMFVLGVWKEQLVYVVVGYDWSNSQRTKNLGLELDYKNLIPSTLYLPVFWNYVSTGILEPVTGKPPFSITEIEKGYRSLKVSIAETHKMVRSIARYGLTKPELDRVEIGRKKK